MISNLSDRASPVDLETKREQMIPRVAEHPSLPISVIVVSYNSSELLRACLTSIAAEQCGEVIVVENASSDGSDELVVRKFPWVRLIKSKTNTGYGAAANLAITDCSSKYVLLLNCDTLLPPGTLKALCDYLDQHPQVAIVGPSLMNPDGTRQASCFAFPTPLQTLRKETSLSKIWPNDLSGGTPRFAQPVPWVLGAALAIRVPAFESVSGFDPSYFMYYEEVDLCYRLNKSGWQTHFMPAATVTHIGGASTKQQRTAMAIQLYKSLCHFYQQHYSRRQSFQLKLVLTYLMLRNIVKDAFKVAHRADSNETGHPMDDLLVWRSVLFNVWSTHGWLKP
jgi:N-acetylglucosaminyl-diphospho-decaprenol L-rhamnosyltransferase